MEDNREEARKYLVNEALGEAERSMSSNGLLPIARAQLSLTRHILRQNERIIELLKEMAAKKSELGP